MSLVQNSFILEIAFFLWICYGYCDQLYDWWIQLSGPSMIGCFNCPITVVRLQLAVRLQLFDYNCTEWLVIYKAADAPIAFQEILMIRISYIILLGWGSFP